MTRFKNGATLAAGLCGLILLAAGCEKSDPPTASIGGPAATANRPAGAVGVPVMPSDDPLHLPMQKAIRPEPVANALPPLQTISRKSVGKIYAEVEKLWPQIRFVTSKGQKIQYLATLETEVGVIEIELLPEIAPNHVRSFIALSQAGYYDGLYFENRVGEPNVKELPCAVAGGSPLADGDDMGGVGYWLRPEILLPEAARERGVRHQPGTVGAVHGFGQLDTAACRFYICLSDAPIWDGEYTIFGKVTRGLEAAKTIFNRSVGPSPSGPAPFEMPPRIEKVTISSQTLETPAAKSDNK